MGSDASWFLVFFVTSRWNDVQRIKKEQDLRSQKWSGRGSLYKTNFWLSQAKFQRDPSIWHSSHKRSPQNSLGRPTFRFFSLSFAICELQPRRRSKTDEERNQPLRPNEKLSPDPKFSLPSFLSVKGLVRFSIFSMEHRSRQIPFHLLMVVLALPQKSLGEL